MQLLHQSAPVDNADNLSEDIDFSSRPNISLGRMDMCSDSEATKWEGRVRRGSIGDLCRAAAGDGELFDIVHGGVQVRLVLGTRLPPFVLRLQILACKQCSTMSGYKHPLKR